MIDNSAICKGRSLAQQGSQPECVGFVPRKLSGHYQKYVSDNGEPILSNLKSEEEYQNYAKSFLAKPVGETILGYTLKEKGEEVVVRFDMETGMYAKGRPGGYIKTCFVAKYCNIKGVPYDDYKHRAADYFVSGMMSEWEKV